MKIMVVENNYSLYRESRGMETKTGWYVLSDSSMTNTGKPFYLPEDMGATGVAVSVAVRISRLGKHIDRKFAPRYYSEFAPALHFKFADYEKRLTSAGLPKDPAMNFDRALFVGEFREAASCNPLFQLYLNKQCVSEFDLKALNMDVDEIIEELSKLNTLKMGDLILPGLTPWIMVNPDDLLDLIHEEKKEFHVKVK